MTTTDKNALYMRALCFEMNLAKLAKSKLRGRMKPRGYWEPGGAVSLKDVPKPTLVADDWLILKTAYCGICGSDMKEITLHGAVDNPLRSFLSFPQIMGHEIVGVVEKTGPAVKRLKAGDRVAVSPWLSCGPRGIRPMCPRCQSGDFTHCHNFQKGQLPAGMHLGVTRGFGGFAPFVAVHESQCFVIPENVSFEAAVLADPFSVAFHSCLLLDPAPSSTVLVYGLGVIGFATVQCLKNLFDVKRVLAVARVDFQKDLAKRFGAEHVFMNSGPKLIEDVSSYLGTELYTPERGSKWAVDGPDGIIDTVGSAETLEAGIRCLTTRGRLVFTGVDTPKRFENTPHYFKELEIIGSNSFSTEIYRNRKAHAFDLFLEFAAQGKIDPAALLTHKYPLNRYDQALEMMAGKDAFGAIKIAFDFT